MTGNFCINCKHVQRSMGPNTVIANVYDCEHPKNLSINPVTGIPSCTNEIRAFREIKCQGEFFEKRKPKWWEFWKREAI